MTQPRLATERLEMTGVMRGMWVQEQLDSSSGVNRLGHAFRIPGPFDLDDFERAVRDRVAVHPVLRSSVTVVDGEPMLDLRDDLDVGLERVDIAGWSDEKIGILLRERADAPYDLEAGPLLRFVAGSVSADEHVVLIAAHHLITDMWSFSMLGREVLEAYGARRAGADAPKSRASRSTFAQHAEAERRLVASPEGDALLDYWRSALRGFDASPVLRTDRPRSVDPDHHGAQVSFEVGDTDAQRLVESSKRLSTTPANVLFAAYVVALARHSGRDDLAITTVRSGRSARSARVQGCFVQPTVVRVEIDRSESFDQLVRRVDAAIADAAAHGDFPLHDILPHIAGLRADGSGSLSALGFSFQKTIRSLGRDVSAAAALGYAGVSTEIGGIRLETTSFVPEPATAEVGLRVAQVADGFVVGMEYMPALFDRVTIERLLGHVESIMRAVLDETETPVGCLPMLTGCELDRLRAWETPQGGSGEDTTVDRLIEASVVEQPGAVAVRHGESVLTYAQLGERADQLADRLRAAGVGPGCTVGLAMPQSVGAVVAAVGIVRVGAAFVQIDRDQPADDLRRVVHECGVRVAVVGDEPPAVMPDMVQVQIDDDGCGAVVGSVDEGHPRAAATDATSLISIAGPDGRPTCVPVQQGHLAGLIRAMTVRLGVESGDVVLGEAPTTFDMSVPDVFVALSAGATIVLVDDDGTVDAGGPRRQIDAAGAKLLFATPTRLRRLLRGGWAGDPRLTVVSRGELLDRTLADRLVSITGSLWNEHGPFEGTAVATLHRVLPGETGVVPVGRPVDGTGCVVLDAFGSRVADEVIGELYLTGRGVAGEPAGTGEGAPRGVAIAALDDAADFTACRTGVLVSRRADGDVRLHGRIDDQVMLRGVRIECVEVEGAVSSHPAIASCAVAVRRAEAGRDQLVAFAVPVAEAALPTLAEIRDHVAALIPHVMMPGLLIPVESIPSTASGGIDRNALPTPDANPNVGWSVEADEAPRPGDETIVADVWRDVLGLSGLSRHDDFFDLGGHSLLATKIASRLRSRFGRVVDVRTVLRNPSVATLAAAIPALSVDSVAPTEAAHDGPMPLTHSQERMWFIHRLNPDSVAYNLAGAVRLRGPLDIDALRGAVHAVVARHDSLRTYFEQVDGVPAQRVAEVGQAELELIELGDVAPEERWAAAKDLMIERARRPFDLAALPLVHFVLVAVGEDDHALLLVQHHIICDQWSTGILAAELSSAYSDLLHGRPLEFAEPAAQLAAFARQHRNETEGQRVEQHLAYWIDRLDGLEPTDLPTDWPRPATRSARGASIEVDVPPSIVSAVSRTCRREGVTPFMVTLAAFQILVSRYTGARDVAIGTAVANRHGLHSENVIGSLVNSLVMRSDVDESLSFRQFLRNVSSTSLDAFAHQDLPFARLVAEMGVDRDPGRTPLFQVFFNVQNAPFASPALDGVDVERIHLDRGAAQFDLSLSIDTTEQRAVLEYDVDLFEAGRMARLLDHYWTLLAGLLDAPDRQLVDTPMTEQPAVVAPAPQEPADDESSPETLHGLFESMAAKYWDAPAITFGDETVTASVLDRRAESLAARLRLAGAEPGDLIGVMLDRSVDMVATVLAVLKCGGAYVPLDPSYPADRLRYIIEHSGLGLLVVDRSDIRLDGIAASVVALDRFESSDADMTPAPPDIGPEDLAYVIYTSGSTGRPKGVQITHANAVNFVRSMIERPGIGRRDRVLASTTLSFDISVLEIFATLAAGARMVLIGHDDQMDPHALARHLDGVTIAQGTPTMWKMLVDAGWSGRPDLTILCGGEALSSTLAAELVARCGTLWNMYGPTETTVWSAVAEIRQGDAVTLGDPIANTSLYVLDGFRRPVPDGVPGELWIGGAGVARGYLHRPDLTAERFADDPFASTPESRIYRTGDLVKRSVDGRLVFLGRLDDQVKVRGHRIELGEIESVMRGHPALVDAVAAVRSFGPDDERLVGYYRPVANRSTDTGEDLGASLRSWVAATLPAYMVPSAYVAVDEFPTTPNNKVDRGRLPDPRPSRATPTELVPPKAGLESTVAGIWSDVLGVESVGRDDNFFRLGGHSLLAVRCFARIDREVGREVPLTTLFEHPTLADFVAAVERGGGADAPRHLTSLVAVNAAGSRQPFFYVSPFLITVLSFSHLSEHLGPDQPFYAIQPQGMEAGEPIHDSVEAMARHYIAEMRTVQPHGPYSVGGHCSGSWVAFEMARQLQAEGERVECLVLVDFGPPQGGGGTVNPLRYVIERYRFYRADGRLRDALRWQLGLAKERFVTRRLGGARAKRAAEVRARHASAHERYRPSPIEGDALLIRTAESVGLRDRAWHLEWSGLLSGELFVDVVGGTHASLVENARSVELADAIGRALAAGDATVGHPRSPGGERIDVV